VEEGAMNKQTILAGLLLLGVMSAASAHDRDHAGNHDGDRSYLGAGLAELSVDDEDFGYEESDNGFKIFGGYEFNEYFAAELTYIGGATVIDETLFPIEEVDLRALSATFIARAPLTSSISMFGKVGIARYETDLRWTDGYDVIEADRFRDNELTYGFGLALSFGHKFELRGEYETIENAFEVMSVSGLIRF
jgi:OOP family OmpA-OmpF porin